MHECLIVSIPEILCSLNFEERNAFLIAVKIDISRINNILNKLEFLVLASSLKKEVPRKRKKQHGYFNTIVSESLIVNYYWCKWCFLIFQSDWTEKKGKSPYLDNNTAACVEMTINNSIWPSCQEYWLYTCQRHYFGVSIAPLSKLHLFSCHVPLLFE